jgi:hypothetical protein
MSEQDAETFFIILMLFTGFVLASALAIKGTVQLDGERQKACAAGVGRYVADPKTGESRFEYGCLLHLKVSEEGPGRGREIPR